MRKRGKWGGRQGGRERKRHKWSSEGDGSFCHRIINSKLDANFHFLLAL